MTKEQIINQLESLKAHCEDFVDRDEEEVDYEALNYEYILKDYESYFEINRIGRYYFMINFCEYY